MLKVVKGILNEDEAELVCSLPISQTGLQDKQIWTPTKNEIFNVKSAHHLNMSRKRRTQGDSSKGISDGWKVLWNLKVLGVVKMFLWKLLNDSLPTKKNLARRKIVENSCYPICEREEESICRAIWSCVGATDVGAEESSPLPKWPSSEVEINEAKDSLLEFQQAQETSEREQGSSVVERRGLKWKKPANNLMKANWDAALNVKEGNMGIGVVIRDDLGEVLVSLCSSKGRVTNPATVELHALWRALKLCVELNFTKVLLEGDALKVVKAVNSIETNWE
ncbi:uncharacterized protein LOC121238127 [Juglans microcarpa x Juglans regia]|uniref:uncharacterized protein LOC121238127 n=1 Tax=Juglans microcarpa x Juglans regia TaxID=2249226 RepID=UPI001B7EF0A1|nr:uncharacterized protein LOC121238127 [Juglans microcarpa x Juglans regia]